MSDVVDFKPKAEVEAAEQLERFIMWAKATLPKGIPHQVHAGIRWDMSSWHYSGFNGASFTALGSPRNAKQDQRRYMQCSFADFAKAFLVHRRVFQRKKDVKGVLYSLRALAKALLELTQKDDCLIKQKKAPCQAISMEISDKTEQDRYSKTAKKGPRKKITFSRFAPSLGRAI